MPRKYPLEVGEVYHVMNKSIAGFKIFNADQDYLRMKRMLQYFALVGSLPKFSQFFELTGTKQKGFEAHFHEFSQKRERHVQIIAYCIMPTHLHLAIKQLKSNAVSTFISNALNSYTRYFNTKYSRKGPLWVGRFKNVPIETDEQLLHLTRYIHLNPVTAQLVEQPQDWQYSSYEEYLNSEGQHICNYQDLLDITSEEYKKFVDGHISYQRDLAQIKAIALE